MIVEPHLDKRTWVGIGQVRLATFLEIVGSDLVRIGHNSVDHLETITVRLVLKMAAYAVECRGGKKCQHRNHEIQSRQRRPIPQVANAPLRAPSRQHSVGQPVADIQQEQQNGSVDGNFFGDVQQNVVPHLVSENE